MRNPKKAGVPRKLVLEPPVRSAVAVRVPGMVGRKPGQTPAPRSVREQLGNRHGQAAPPLGWP